MPPLPAISESSLSELASQIQKGQRSSQEVVRHFITAIQARNSELNALVVSRFEEARQRAAAADEALARGENWGRLHGVPITIKECLDWEGTPSTFGLPRRKNDRPKENDPYVQALLGEGAILLGKTNVAQLLAYFEADNTLYGRSLNPLHPDFSPGGSSGGSAALVAAGGSPLGIGTDLGGSVRVPAAFCGIVGLKPTMQRNYDFSRFVEQPHWRGICSVTGPIARKVDDLALAADIMGGIPNPFNPSPRPFPDYKTLSAKHFRLGYYLSDGLFEPTDAIRQAILETVRRLEQEGVRCHRISAYRPEVAEALHTQFNSFDGARLFLENLGGDRPCRQLKGLVPLMKAPNWTVRLLGRLAGWLGQKSVARMSRHFGKSTEEDMRRMLSELQAYRQGYLDMMEAEGVDAILSPVNALPAYPHGTSTQLGNGGTYTLTHNVTGFPAGVVTVGRIAEGQVKPRAFSWDWAENIARRAEKQSEGLPLAVQLAARPWREDVVLCFMAAIERLFPVPQGG